MCEERNPRVLSLEENLKRRVTPYRSAANERVKGHVRLQRQGTRRVNAMGRPVLKPQSLVCAPQQTKSRRFAPKTRCTWSPFALIRCLLHKSEAHLHELCYRRAHVPRVRLTLTPLKPPPQRTRARERPTLVRDSLHSEGRREAM
jgi:hypothetical protein